MSAPLTEAAFLKQVLDLAHLRGWSTYHPRPGRTLDSWRTAGTGTMAKGFPDLVLARPPTLIFAELKRDGGKLTPEQAHVLEVLAQFMVEVPEIPDDFPIPKQRSYLDGIIAGLDKALAESPKIAVAVWRPRNWSAIEEALA